jgi:hypothetical protein
VLGTDSDRDVFDSKGFGMTCHSCGSADQRGRFCNRCGSKRTPTAPPGGTWAVRRAVSRGRADVERRLPASARPPGASRGSAGRAGAHAPARERTTGLNGGTIRDLYDTALARGGPVGDRPLERYLSVLLASPGSTCRP